MSTGFEQAGRLPGIFTTPGSSSFVEFLNSAAPQLLPWHQEATHASADLAPHGTTVVAAEFEGGVVMAGDRRATMGNLIANRDVQKIFPADAYSVVGIAGALGAAIELVRLFSLELEHYEKREGATLSLPGKANRLSAIIRGNLALAMQGLAVVPIFAGFDPDADVAAGQKATRIFGYDITGGYNEEHDFYSVGSGSIFARSALKKRYKPGLSSEQVVRLCIEALYDAADDDSATGGPDMSRRIYPTVMVVDAEGSRQLPESEITAVAGEVVEGRLNNPGG